jgi:DNA helicase-2/ATP-dependent DNA helicase PcrA
VGDPNQTIFSFTGASNSFLLGFANRYDQAQTFELRRNYRSTKQIVNFANRLTRDQGWMGPLEGNDGNGPAPRIREFENAQAEANAVAQDIRTLLDSGTAAKDIAVLFRINGQSEIYENALSQLRIEYQVRGGVRYFQRSEIQAALRAIRAEASVADPEVNLYAKVSEIIRSLGWSAKMPDDSAMRDTWEALNALLEIADELGDSATLNDLSRELEDRAKSQHEPTRAAVTLATMHATKGLEWPKVYVVGLVDGLMPISFAKTEIELAEEKRLLYVAITRAEQFLQLSWAKNDTNQSTGQRSRFLTLLESPLQ